VLSKRSIVSVRHSFEYGGVRHGSSLQIQRQGDRCRPGRISAWTNEATLDGDYRTATLKVAAYLRSGRRSTYRSAA